MASPITTILFFNDDWHMAPRALPDCPRPCHLLFERARLPDADWVVFHLPTLQEPITAEKSPGQGWVAWCMESQANYPQLADPAFMARFDLRMTYRRDADIWTPYFDASLAQDLATPPRPKTEAVLAVYFASNPWDTSGRGVYAAELMRHLQVDSYGRCLRNKELVQDAGRSTKMETIAAYKFSLAFENSVSRDYVTEKFFDPLVAGSVPIYLGAPNIAEFAPADRCFIDVADFPQPRALADYLRFLDVQDLEYASYLAWKSADLKPSFLALLAQTCPHPLCRLGMHALPAMHPNGSSPGSLPQ
jgi:hypothetical protein